MREIFIYSRIHNNDGMSKYYNVGEIERINFSELERPLYFRVPYGSNGKARSQVCRIESALTRGQVLVSTQIRATGYHIDGLLMFDEHEPTDFGERIRDYVLERGLDVSYDEKGIHYCKRTSSRGNFGAKLTRFVGRVADVSKSVDKMILAHLRRVA